MNSAAPNLNSPARIVCILRGPGAEQSVVDRAIAVLKGRGVEVVETDRDAPATRTDDGLKACGLVVTLGGDGTFLAGARFAAPKGIPLLGVNLGRLGFLTEVEAEHLEEGLKRFLDGDYRIEERTILQVALSRGTRTVARAIGLNEVVVDHSGEARMLRVEIDVGGQAVGVIDADGVMVATATGSTAYALASGGPILEPTLRDLVLVPMNPFALTVRPIVFPPGEDIRLSVLRGPAEMRIDGRRGRAVATGDSVRCSSHARRLKVVRFSPPEEFYRRLGEKLGWGRPLVPKK
ncbi:MAG TPA: NAD(+)/NADH kinase [Candidatus Dormibacteraeota bacterium]|nr:NAD(+)/NADH kinase [Candidatus Dormibacteraeota bacterium]